jgi:hypothetical protein
MKLRYLKKNIVVVVAAAIVVIEIVVVSLLHQRVERSRRSFCSHRRHGQ